jgi:hypothetical protein
LFVRRIFIAAWLSLGACSFNGAVPIGGDAGTQSQVDASPTSGVWWNDAYGQRERSSAMVNCAATVSTFV